MSLDYQFQNTKSKWLTMSVSAVCKFITQLFWNMPNPWPQNSFKMDIVDIYTLFKVSKAAGKHTFQLLFTEVGDSQQWMISPSNGGQFLTTCSRSSILPTYTRPNHLKRILYIEETSLYEIILSIIITILLFSCSGTAKLAKLPQGQWFLFIFWQCLETQCPENVTFHLHSSIKMCSK